MLFIKRINKTKKKASEASGVIELTSEQKSDVLRVFDRSAALKAYNLNGIAMGYRNATEVEKTALQRTFERVSAAEGMNVPFQDALSFMIKEGYIIDAPEKKFSDGRPMGIEPVYILTKKMLNRFLERIKFSPEREKAVCESLVLGMDFLTPGLKINKTEILYALKRGLYKAGFIEPDNINPAFLGLVTGEWLLVNDMPISQNFRVDERTCSFYPSEQLVKKYNMPAIWGKRYEPTPEEQISEMERAYWRGRAKAQSKIIIPQVQPLP